MKCGYTSHSKTAGGILKISKARLHHCSEGTMAILPIPELKCFGHSEYIPKQ
jgi:hypothetical protein